jgi:hypothetical protein
MDSKLPIHYIVFAKEMKNLMEFQKYIDIHQNFDKKYILVDYFEELYNYISNFDCKYNNKKNDIINLIKTLITNKIVINIDFLENEKSFNDDYMIVIEIFRLILEYDNINDENDNDIKKVEKKLIKKFKKITLD